MKPILTKFNSFNQIRDNLRTNTKKINFNQCKHDSILNIQHNIEKFLVNSQNVNQKLEILNAVKLAIKTVQEAVNHGGCDYAVDHRYYGDYNKDIFEQLIGVSSDSDNTKANTLKESLEIICLHRNVYSYDKNRKFSFWGTNYTKSAESLRCWIDNKIQNYENEFTVKLAEVESNLETSKHNQPADVINVKLTNTDQYTRYMNQEHSFYKQNGFSTPTEFSLKKGMFCNGLINNIGNKKYYMLNIPNTWIRHNFFTREARQFATYLPEEKKEITPLDNTEINKLKINIEKMIDSLLKQSIKNITIDISHNKYYFILTEQFKEIFNQVISEKDMNQGLNLNFISEPVQMK